MFIVPAGWNNHAWNVKPREITFFSGRTVVFEVLKSMRNIDKESKI